MTKIEPTGSTPKTRRWWFQCGTRIVLLLVLVASIGFSWIAVKIKRQREAVAAIEELGGDVRYESTLGLKTVIEVDFSGNAIGDEDLAHIEALSQVQSLRLSSTFVTDGGLGHLENMATLRVLDLTSLNITDDGLAHLRGLTRLRWLELRDTDVTQAGVEGLKQALPKCEIDWEPPSEEERQSGLKGDQRRRLRMRTEAIDAIAALGGEVEVADGGVRKRVSLVRLRGAQVTDDALWVLERVNDHLRVVDLRDSRVTDEGLRYIRFMPQLETVYLQNTCVTDAGLEHLQELPQLRALDLADTAVTETGVNKLQRRFPDCKITWTAPRPDDRQSPAAPDQVR